MSSPRDGKPNSSEAGHPEDNDNDLPLSRNMSGVWVVDRDQSDSIEPLMGKLGVNWLARRMVKNVEVVSIILHTPIRLHITDKSKLGKHETECLLDNRFHLIKQGEKEVEARASHHPATGILHLEIKWPGGGRTVDMRRLQSRTSMRQTIEYFQSSKDAKPELVVTRVLYKQETQAEKLAEKESELVLRRRLAVLGVQAADWHAAGLEAELPDLPSEDDVMSISSAASSPTARLLPLSPSFSSSSSSLSSPSSPSPSASQMDLASPSSQPATSPLSSPSSSPSSSEQEPGESRVSHADSAGSGGSGGADGSEADKEGGASASANAKGETNEDEEEDGGEGEAVVGEGEGQKRPETELAKGNDSCIASESPSASASLAAPLPVLDVVSASSPSALASSSVSAPSTPSSSSSSLAMKGGDDATVVSAQVEGKRQAQSVGGGGEDGEEGRKKKDHEKEKESEPASVQPDQPANQSDNNKVEQPVDQAAAQQPSDQGGEAVRSPGKQEAAVAAEAKEEVKEDEDEKAAEDGDYGVSGVWKLDHAKSEHMDPVLEKLGEC